MTVPSQLTQVGFALEAVYGTAVNPVMGMPYTAFDAADNNGLIPDRSWRGSAADVYAHETGVLDSSIAPRGMICPDTIGYLLAGVTGDYTFTAGTPNTHAFALLNTGTQQPPSYTVTTVEPVGVLQRPGCKVQSLKLSVSGDQLLSYDANMAGLVSAAPGGVTVPAASSERVIPGWGVAATIGGSSEPRLLSATMQFSRPVGAKRNSQGAQSPWLQRTGALSVTGDVALAITVDAYRAGFLAGTTTSIDLNYQAGVGAALRQLKLHCSQVAISNLKRNYGGKWIELAFSWEAEANTTDAGASGGRSPVKVTLKNQVGAGVYK